MPTISLTSDELAALMWALTDAINAGKKQIDETGKPPTVPDWKVLNELKERIERDHY
jgi:hypothetical protein